MLNKYMAKINKEKCIKILFGVLTFTRYTLHLISLGACGIWCMGLLVIAMALGDNPHNQLSSAQFYLVFATLAHPAITLISILFSLIKGSKHPKLAFVFSLFPMPATIVLFYYFF